MIAGGEDKDWEYVMKEVTTNLRRKPPNPIPQDRQCYSVYIFNSMKSGHAIFAKKLFHTDLLDIIWAFRFHIEDHEILKW